VSLMSHSSAPIPRRSLLARPPFQPVQSTGRVAIRLRIPTRGRENGKRSPHSPPLYPVPKSPTPCFQVGAPQHRSTSAAPGIYVPMRVLSTLPFHRFFFTHDKPVRTGYGHRITCTARAPRCAALARLFPRWQLKPVRVRLMVGFSLVLPTAPLLC